MADVMMPTMLGVHVSSGHLRSQRIAPERNNRVSWMAPRQALCVWQPGIAVRVGPYKPACDTLQEGLLQALRSRVSRE